MTAFVVELPARVGADGHVVAHGPVSVTVDAATLVAEEWSKVAVELARYALATGVHPDEEVAVAAVALQVIRRDPRLADITFSDLVHVDVYRDGWTAETLAELDEGQLFELARLVSER